MAKEIKFKIFECDLSHKNNFEDTNTIFDFIKKYYFTVILAQILIIYTNIKYAIVSNLIHLIVFRFNVLLFTFIYIEFYFKFIPRLTKFIRLD